jgi:hypothetical protein
LPSLKVNWKINVVNWPPSSRERFREAEPVASQEPPRRQLVRSDHRAARNASDQHKNRPKVESSAADVPETTKHWPPLPGLWQLHF